MQGAFVGNGIGRLVEDQLEAISLLQKANKHSQILTILYSSIDTMAWLAKGDGDVTRHDFVEWVDRYMLIDSTIEATAMDLYAARCSVLHNHAAEAKLTREGKARQIWYYGRNQKDVLQAQIAKSGENAVALRTLDLVSAYTFGVDRFMDGLSSSQEIEAVARKLKKVLRFVYDKTMDQ